MNEQDIIKSLQHMDDEQKKAILGGMAWDQICWDADMLMDKYNWTEEELICKFPKLFNANSFNH